MTIVLETRQVEKPWGRDQLMPPFVAPKGTRIGEIWFVPPTELDDLLVKYIFTSENLSVQVHPSDQQTEALAQGKQGKEECWLILDAEPDARLAIGFEQEIAPDAMRKAALDGSIEQLLRWYPVKAGDFFYIPANTVHAIGAGITLIEVQQNSDITYRLYDYGRPRELHLDQGIAVAQGTPYDMQRLHRRIDAGASAMLVDGPYFRLEQVANRPSAQTHAHFGDGALLVIPRIGSVRIGDVILETGQCGLAASIDRIDFSASALCLVAQPIIN